MMDQAVTRAAGVTPSTTPPTAAARRSWSILLTSANHGVVGPLGSTFPHAGEHHERVVVVEVPAAAGAPIDQVNLQLATVADRQVAVERALKAALDWANEEYVCARNLGKGEPGTHAACDAKQAACTAAIRALAAPVAAQAGQVAVPEGFVLVPIKPTPKMVNATFNHIHLGIESHNARNKRIYAAMIAAAPSPAKESK